MKRQLSGIIAGTMLAITGALPVSATVTKTISQHLTDTEYHAQLAEDDGRVAKPRSTPSSVSNLVSNYLHNHTSIPTLKFDFQALGRALIKANPFAHSISYGSLIFAAIMASIIRQRDDNN